VAFSLKGSRATAQQHQHSSISTAASAQQHQHSSISTAASAQQHQHSSISTALSVVVIEGHGSSRVPLISRDENAQRWQCIDRAGTKSPSTAPAVAASPPLPPGALPRLGGGAASKMGNVIP